MNQMQCKDVQELVSALVDGRGVWSPALMKIARVGAHVLNAPVGELPDMSFARNFCCGS
jgi:hypothetical protein